MIQQQGLVAEGQRGQRRGLVLGFTMAELMLLLLFCLLLVSAATLLRKQTELAEAQKRVDQLEQIEVGGMTADEAASLRGANTHLAALLSLLFGGTIPSLTPAQVDDLWRELKLARDASTAMANAGLDPNSPGAIEGLVEVSAMLTEAGISQDQLNAALAMLASLAQGGLKDLSPDVLAQLAAALAGKDGRLDPDRASALSAMLDALAAAGIKQPTPEQMTAMAAAIASPGANSAPHDWPPIISLNDDGNRFELGSAEIKPAFRQSLETSVAPQLAELLEQYDVDVVEIIGHTDETKITPTRPSNLDLDAISAARGDLNSNSLVPVDNAGLGLARAIAVANTLKATGRFPGVKVVPLSAAQLMLPGDILSDGSRQTDDRTRRRIEIRVRQTTRSKSL